MADNYAFGEAKRIEHAHNVSNQLLLGIRFDWLWRISFTIAALIRRDSVKSGLSECAHLMPP